MKEGYKMNIKIFKLNLQNAIEKAEKLLPKKTQLRILESVLLTAKDCKITLTAHNLRSTIIIDVDGQIIEEGSILINKGNFKLIKKLTDELSISDDQGTVKIEANRKLKFQQQDYTEFPEFDVEVNNFAFTIQEKVFKDCLKIKTFACLDEARPVLNGCCIRDHQIIAVDGYQMAKFDLPIKNECPSDIIISLDSIDELDKILDKRGMEKLKFEYYNEERYDKKNKEKKEIIKRLKITGDGWKYITKIIEGEFLKFDQIFPNPDRYTKTVEINTTDLQKSIDFAIEVLASSNVNILTFEIENAFTLSAKCDEKEMSEILPSNINNDRQNEYLKIVFNPRHLLNVCKTIKGDNIQMNFIDNVSPMVVNITEQNTLLESYIVVPMRMYN